MRRRIALLVLMLLTASSLRAATLTLAEYRDTLARMRSLIAAGQIDAARTEAKSMTGSEVDSPNGRFHTDSTLLAEINAATTRDLRVENHIDATLSALRNLATTKPIATDRRLLQRLQREQSVPELPRGGDIHGVPVKDPLLKRIGAAIRKVVVWIVEKIGELWDWLSRFWPESGTKEKPASPGMRWTVGTLVAMILIVLGVLAFAVIRRSRRAAPLMVEESIPLRSSRDDDPLSRGANEWERYAAQLAASGRLREAIRAWFHAVLVTLYGANVLQFRKGRTNWEYVAALSPEIAWRPTIIHLTRRFEEEWYGSDQSSAEALNECRATARTILEVVRRGKREAA